MAKSTEEQDVPTSAVQAIGHAFVRLSEKQNAGRPGYAIYAFMTMVVALIASFSGRPMTPWLAAVLLAILALASLTTILLLRGVRNRRRKSAGSAPKARWTQYAMPVVLLVALLVAAYRPLVRSGVLPRLLPRQYPVETAVASLTEHFDVLDRLLQSKTDEERLQAFMAFANTMTNDMQRRNLPKGAAELVGLWPNLDANQRATAIQLSNQYRRSYLLADRVSIESLSQETWRRLSSSGGRETLYMIAVVSYSGRFFPNEFAERKLQLGSIAAALLDPASEDARIMKQVTEHYFPNADSDRLWDAISGLRGEYLFRQNAVDLIAWAAQSAVGDPDENQSRFGYEVTITSMKLERNRDESGWRVSEVGKWGLNRVFTGSRVEVAATAYFDQVLLDDVPYAAQADPSLCQSAALEMLWRKLDGEHASRTQESIRAELGKDPLSHSSRLEWSRKNLPGYKWKPVYETSYPRVIGRIRDQLRRGVPVVMSTRLTSAGHVIVITGMWRDSNGEVVVRSHDPRGKFDFVHRQYGQSTGRDVQYPLRELYVMSRQWIDTKGNESASQYVVGTEEWQPAISEQLKKGLTAKGPAIKDWEWLGVED